jgi:hypothetical protein
MTSAAVGLESCYAGLLNSQKFGRESRSLTLHMQSHYFFNRHKTLQRCFAAFLLLQHLSCKAVTG